MSRANHHQSGLEAEGEAVAALEAQGYAIRDRNWRCPYGEVDVVAEKGELICFVEVRMKSFGDPAETVSAPKQRRIVRTALQYLFEHRISGRGVRFDVVTVVGQGQERLVEHIPDAFDAGM